MCLFNSPPLLSRFAIYEQWEHVWFENCRICEERKTNAMQHSDSLRDIAKARLANLVPQTAGRVKDTPRKEVSEKRTSVQ
jgi:hypothetical protein